MSHIGSDPKAAENAEPARRKAISTRMRSCGFLPEHDPLIGFPSNSEFSELDKLAAIFRASYKTRAFAFTRAHWISRFGPKIG